MANLNTALTPAPVVTVVNKDGTTATGYTGNVTMALGTNPSNATLGGTTTVAASSGVATFSNLTLDRSGKNYTLRATAAEQGGVTPRARVSAPFTIATQLTFTTQPTGVAPDDIIPTFTVTVQDSAGNTDTNYAGEVTVALYTGAALGILSGLYTRSAVAGVVDFSGLSIDAEGTYSLRATATAVATAYTPAPVISNTFSITSLTVPNIIVQYSPSSILGFDFDGSNAHTYTNPVSSNINVIAGIGEQYILLGDLSSSSAASVCQVGASEITLIDSPAYNLPSANAVAHNSAFLVFDYEFSAITAYTSLDGQYINEDGTLGASFSNSLATSPFITGAGLPTVCQTVAFASDAIIIDNGGGSSGDPSLIVASLDTDYSNERVYQSAIQTSNVSQIAYDQTSSYIYRCLNGTNSPTIEVGAVGGLVITVTSLIPFSAANSGEYEYGPIACNSTYLFVILNDKTSSPVARVFRYAKSDWSVTELTSSINKPVELLSSIDYIDRSRMLIISN